MSGKYGWRKIFHARLRINVNPLLRTEGLSVTYSAHTGAAVAALRDVHFSLDRGEIVAITGPSGSGKSSLALALLRALPRNTRVDGVVEFTGSSISPIFQEPLLALHPMLCLGRQIYEAVKARRQWNHRRTSVEVENALELAGLDPSRFFKVWPHKLSGGQRHRALIAQAIAGSPDLIVADEPTSSLDADAAAEMVGVLRNLRDRFGTAILFITHSSALLPGFADRVLHMYEGQLVG